MSKIDLIIKQDEDDVEAAEVLVLGIIGNHEYHFLLDTGAAITSVEFDEYTSTFACVDKKRSSGLFAECVDDLIMVPSIKIGSISKRNFTLARIAQGNPEIRNLVGMDLLKDHCCHFLFDEHSIIVDPNEESTTGWMFQDLFLDKAFHPYVDVQFGELQAKAVWDTGAGITIVDVNFIQKHSTFFQEVGYSNGTDSTGAKVKTPMFIMGATTIGNYEFPPHKVAGVNLSQVNSALEVPMDLILGYSTLSQANWWFDFPRKVWAIPKRLDVR